MKKSSDADNDNEEVLRKILLNFANRHTFESKRRKTRRDHCSAIGPSRPPFKNQSPASFDTWCRFEWMLDELTQKSERKVRRSFDRTNCGAVATPISHHNEIHLRYVYGMQVHHMMTCSSNELIVPDKFLL